MPLERIEHHRYIAREPTRLQKVGRLMATGGLSALSEPEPPLSDEQREELEGRGYDPNSVQPMIDWLETRGVNGERAAAVLRGAFNDLVERVNLQESSTEA